MASSISEATADLCDRLGSEARVCLTPFVSYGGRRQAMGRIACVRVDEDASPVRRMIEEEGQGRILIVNAAGSRRVALLGERMARLALGNGWGGVVIHGAIRDACALGTVDLAVFALCAVPRRAESGRVAAFDDEAPVTFGGVTFAAGEWACLDGDGLVVVREIG